MVAARDFDDERAGVADGSRLFADSQQTFTRAEVDALLHELHAARAALRACDERLDLALDSATAALWTWDPAMDRFQWSPHLARNWGLESTTLARMADWGDHIHPDDVVRVMAEHDAALAARRAFVLEFRLLLPNGEARWVTSNGRGTYDDAGNLTCVAGVLTDITVHKTAEAMRQAADARIRAQWESSPVATFVWQVRNGHLTLVDVNPAAERMTHGKAHEFLGLTAEQIYPDRPDLRERLQTCLTQQSTIHYTAEYHTRGTNLDRIIEFTMAYMAPDSVLLHTEDVTDFRRAEMDLLFTQTVIDRMNDAAYWAGEDGCLVYVNDAACAMLGYARDELLALRVYDVVDDYNAVKWRAHWDGLKQHGGRRFETRHRRKDGSIVPVEVQTLIVTLGNRTYACAMARDISERQAMEAALRASEAKFASLFEMSPIALTIARAEDGIFVDANNVALQANGYSREEFLGRTASELQFYVDNGERAAIQAVLGQNDRVSNRPVKLRDRYGDIHECLISVSTVVIDDEPYYLTGVVDIDPLRKVERDLRASQEKFASFFELSPVSLAITRAEDGLILEINRAFTALSGYRQDELLGHTALELGIYANPADRTAIVDTIAHKGQVTGRPMQVRIKDASVIDCLLSMKLVSIDDVPCYMAGLIDMTPLRQAESALRTQQAAMLALLENTDSSIWSIDSTYRLTACNSIFRHNVRASLGVDLAIGESVLQGDAEINAEWRNLYDRTLAGERLIIDVQRRFAKRGNWMEYRLSPVYDAGGAVTGVTALGRDITARKQAAAQIEEQLAEISLYYNTAPVGLAVLDTDLRFVRINKSLAAMNGVAVEDHIGRRVADVVPLLEDQARQLATTILATGEPVTDIEIVGETPADPGVAHTWREHWYPIKRSDGTITGFNVTADDITERKRTRELLERSQQNLARAQEIGHLGSWEWDLLNQRLEWSDELYRIFGVDKGFVPSYAAIEALIHPDDRAYDNEQVQDALAEGSKTEFEMRIIRPDGDVRHVYEYIEIERDTAGAARKLFGVVQDITERKLVEAALRRRERNLNEAERIAQSGSWEYDLAADRVLWSDNMYRIFDVDAELPAANFYDYFHQRLIHPDDRVRIQRAFDEATAGGHSYDVEYRVARKDGAIRHIHSIAAVMRDEAGRAQRLVGWVQDVTEQKQAMEERERLQAQLAQAQKMETVGRLAGGIAHDFNNLLAVILLRTEMALQMAGEDTPLHRSLTTIHATAQRSASLVQQLLGFARRQAIVPRVVDLNEAVLAMLPMLEKLIGEEIDLRWRPGDDLWPVKMDPSQLDQILTNLCVNARDAIDGIGRITIAAANATVPHLPGGDERTVPGDEYVVLSVADTGRGIAPDVLEHIFEPFFTTKGVGKGTGLGLATVEGIVEQNKGQIQVTSTPGLGTTFTVYLPRFAEPVAPQTEPAATTIARGDGQRVLLVEDELVVLDMASEALRSLGYTVYAFPSPVAALRILEDDSFTIDVLITDVIMPEMNGALLAERVRQRRPAIKTLFVSGYPADYMADRGILPDDANFLTKPFSRQGLAAKVAAVLGVPPA